MSLKGGYAIVDCTGIDLHDLGEVTGIYAKVKGAVDTGKPIVLYNLVNDSQAFTPITAYGGVENSTTVFLSFFPVTLHITNEDVVSM